MFVVASLAAAFVLVTVVAIPQWLSKQARWEALRSHVGEIGQVAASVMSVIPLKADIRQRDLHVRLVP